jgi:uncharacterized protein
VINLARLRSGAIVLLALAVVLVASGCRTYKGRTGAARAAFYRGDFERAADLYARGSSKPGRNRLLYLLDAGMAYRAAKDWDQSNRCFIAADNLIEELNFKSRSEAVASLIWDDRALTYRGEEFEAVLVNTFLALNWLQQGAPQSAEKALVECRRFDWKLRQFRDRRGSEYLQNAFSRYLSGAAYEMDGEPNDAYIDYQAVHKLRPDFQPVKRDLVRLAARLGFADHLEKWEKKFGIKHEAEALAGSGEVLVVLEAGRAPEKGPINEDEFLHLPKYYSFAALEAGAEVVVKDQTLARTIVLEDIDATARKTLSKRLAGTVAKKIGKGVIKVGAALGTRMLVREATRRRMKKYQSRLVSDLAALLVYALLSATDRTDTRCWMALPANLQVARLRLPAGEHTVRLHITGPGGERTGHVVEFSKVQVRKGGITLLATRTLQ